MGKKIKNRIVGWGGAESNPNCANKTKINIYSI
jgi:hypothetical protein